MGPGESAYSGNMRYNVDTVPHLVSTVISLTKASRKLWEVVIFKQIADEPAHETDCVRMTSPWWSLPNVPALPDYLGPVATLPGLQSDFLVNDVLVCFRSLFQAILQQYADVALTGLGQTSCADEGEASCWLLNRLNCLYLWVIMRATVLCGKLERFFKQNQYTNKTAQPATPWLTGILICIIAYHPNTVTTLIITIAVNTVLLILIIWF